MDWVSFQPFMAPIEDVKMCFLPGKALGERVKSKNDTWSEKELAKHISKGSTAGKLNKTSPEVYE